MIRSLFLILLFNIITFNSLSAQRLAIGDSIVFQKACSEFKKIWTKENRNLYHYQEFIGDKCITDGRVNYTGSTANLNKFTTQSLMKNFKDSLKFCNRDGSVNSILYIRDDMHTIKYAIRQYERGQLKTFAVSNRQLTSLQDSQWMKNSIIVPKGIYTLDTLKRYQNGELTYYFSDEKNGYKKERFYEKGILQAENLYAKFNQSYSQDPYAIQIKTYLNKGKLTRHVFNTNSTLKALFKMDGDTIFTTLYNEKGNIASETKSLIVGLKRRNRSYVYSFESVFELVPISFVKREPISGKILEQLSYEDFKYYRKSTFESIVDGEKQRLVATIPLGRNIVVAKEFETIKRGFPNYPVKKCINNDLVDSFKFYTTSKKYIEEYTVQYSQLFITRCAFRINSV